MIKCTTISFIYSLSAKLLLIFLKNSQTDSHLMMLNIFTFTMSKNLVTKQFHFHSYLDLDFKKQRELPIHVQRKHIKKTKVPGCTIMSRILFERFVISTKHGATTCTKWRMLWAGKLETLRNARIATRGNKQRERKRESICQYENFWVGFEVFAHFLNYGSWLYLPKAHKNAR